MYRAPVSEISHCLKNVAGLSDALAAGFMGDLSEDLVEAIVEEAGKFATEVIAPLHLPTDRNGAKLNDGVVTTSPGFKEAYRQWTDAGWNALTGPVDFDGQGLPMTMGMAATEMWNAGSMAFGLCPMLTMGAIEALEAHASDALKQSYLAKLVSGQWTGTMNLTEPQAGSDLAALKARAERREDGSYRIFGQKIYITFGEHDMTDNIVHLVLARLPDAPSGTRGISLFLVPKFLLDENGEPSTRNDVFCNGLEHKMGIHASPTCTMIFGDGKFGEEAGAIGWLIGEENRGLTCMFTMMNNARLAVGIQGVSVSEAATQKALDYARERKQGKAADHVGEGMAPIILHPDVQRNILTMRALTNAARAICYSCAYALDMARYADEKDRAFWADRASLITPIAKAFSTDIGSQVASIGVQVHGGMGYVEETGAAVYMRDARIAQIYEGTNGIQGIDLALRKLPLGNGACVDAYLNELDTIVNTLRASNQPAFGDSAERIGEAMAELRAATRWMLDQSAAKNHQAVLAAATPYQHMFGLAAGGAYLAKSALVDPEHHERVTLCRFYAENLIDECASLRRRVEHGADSLGAAAEFLVA